MSDRVRCSRCGKGVSNSVTVDPNPLTDELVVRAWVECPECIEAKPEPTERFTVGFVYPDGKVLIFGEDQPGDPDREAVERRVAELATAKAGYVVLRHFVTEWEVVPEDG